MNLSQDLIGTKLFIGDLATLCDEGHIQEIFRSHGFDTCSVRLMRGKQSLASLNYGFVELKTKEEAARAIAVLDLKMAYGRKLRVKWAAPNITSENSLKSANSIRVKFKSLKAELTITEEILRQVFSTFGAISDVSVKVSNMDRTFGIYDIGYGFVHFTSRDEGIAVAFNAIKETKSGPITYDGVEYICEPSKSLIRNAHRARKEQKQLKVEQDSSDIRDFDSNSTFQSSDFLSFYGLSIKEYDAPRDQFIQEVSAYETAVTKQNIRSRDHDNYDNSHASESMTDDSSIRSRSIAQSSRGSVPPVIEPSFPEYLGNRCKIPRPPGFPPSENDYASMDPRRLARPSFPNPGTDPHLSQYQDRSYQSAVAYQNENCPNIWTSANDSQDRYSHNQIHSQVASIRQALTNDLALDRDNIRSAFPTRLYECADDWDYEVAKAYERKSCIGPSSHEHSFHSDFVINAAPFDKSSGRTANSEVAYGRSKAESWTHYYNHCSKVPAPRCTPSHSRHVNDRYAEPLPGRSDVGPELNYAPYSSSSLPYERRMAYHIRSQAPQTQRDYVQSADPRMLYERSTQHGFTRMVDMKNRSDEENENRLSAFMDIRSFGVIYELDGVKCNHSSITTDSNTSPDLSMNSGSPTCLHSQGIQVREVCSRSNDFVDMPVLEPIPSGGKAHSATTVSIKSVGAASNFINMATSAGQSVRVDMRSYMLSDSLV